MANPHKKPHKRKHKMTEPWDTASKVVSSELPGTEPGNENDGVQRMFDYIEDAEQNPNARAYAAVTAYADQTEHFAALVSENKVPARQVLNMAGHQLAQTAAALETVIYPSIKHGHKKADAIAKGTEKDDSPNE